MIYKKNNDTFLKLFNLYCYELGLEEPSILESINEKAEFVPPFDMNEFINENEIKIIIDDNKAIGFLAYTFKNDVLELNEFFIMKPYMTIERINDSLNFLFVNKKGKFITHLPKTSIELISELEKRYPYIIKKELDEFAWIFECKL